MVEAKLTLRWSPEQIAGWVPLADPDDPTMRISHETIYLSLYVQRRGHRVVTGDVACAPAEPCATRTASACPREEAS